MIKTIDIEGQPVEINSSLGWLFCYREQFGHDILPDLLPLLDAALGALSEIYDGEEEINIFEKLDEDTVNRIITSLSTLEVLTVTNILWAMAKNAGETKQPFEWVNEFNVFPFDTVVPEVFRVLIESSVSSKNLKRLLEKIPILSKSTQTTSLLPEQEEVLTSEA